MKPKPRSNIVITKGPLYEESNATKINERLNLAKNRKQTRIRREWEYEQELKKID